MFNPLQNVLFLKLQFDTPVLAVSTAVWATGLKFSDTISNPHMHLSIKQKLC
jgi:hypothetical protein